MLRKTTQTLTATGSAGSATAEATFSFGAPWRVYALIFDYTGLPSSTDVTVTDGSETVQSTVLIESNTEADKVVYPRAAASKAADGSASTLTEVLPVVESLKVTLTQGNPGGTLKVTVFCEE